jgi:tripartite-type tricarboxylate transporter receptor subunit TctC
MMSRVKFTSVLALSGLLLTSVAAFAQSGADSVASFYKGRTINLLIGYSVGGGYDLYARLLSRHIGRHIPGNPNVVPQSMPGAGSLKVVNYLSQVAPKDGTAIGTFGRSLPLYPLLIAPADFDGTKLGYLGSITQDTSICISWHTSPIQNWNDLLTKEYRAGGEGRGSEPDVFANVLQKVFGSNTRLVTGYPGTAEMTLAMERGELDGLCGISYSTLQSIHNDWLVQKKVNILVQASLEKHPAIPEVPLILDLVTDPVKKKIVELIVAPQEMARPFATPPGVPEERLKALRQAFDETMTDPEFLADAKKSNLDVNPVSGQRIQDLVASLWASPKEVIAAAAAASGAETPASKKAP